MIFRTCWQAPAVAILALAWTGLFKEHWGMGWAKPGLTAGLF